MTTPPPPQPYATRLDAIFARDAPLAVILRRGPRSHWQLLSWDLTTDRIARGQWMKGMIRLADLSPSGRYLLYFAAQYHRPSRLIETPRVPGPYDPAKVAAPARPKNRRYRKVPRYQREALRQGERRRIADTWTSLSRPPFFSALALWPAFGTWTGGGQFLSDHAVMINERGVDSKPAANVPLPQRFTVEPAPERAVPWPPACGIRPSFTRRSPHSGLWQVLGDAGLTDIDFVHLVPSGGMIVAQGGRLLRFDQWSEAPDADAIGHARIIADLNGQRFALLAPTSEAMSW
jgi:hypothetical protein